MKEFEEYEEQSIDEFNDWFTGNKIQANWEIACETLKNKIFNIIDMDILMKAFYSDGIQQKNTDQVGFNLDELE